MKTLILLSFFSLTLSASAQTVFSVGNSKVSLDEFKKRLSEYKSTTYNPPTADQLLEDWIRFEVGVQEAEKQKLQNDPAVKERFRQVLYNALLEKSLGKKIEALPVSEPEMKSYYSRNPEIRISHIFIEYPAKATPEQKETARNRANEIYQDVRKQTRGKRQFEELVKLYSDDLTTKENGGDMGFQSRVTVPFYDHLVKMKIGEISQPLQSRQGFHIVKVTGHNPYDESDKRQVRAAVFDEKRAKLFNEFFEKLKHQYHISVNKGALKEAAQQ